MWPANHSSRRGSVRQRRIRHRHGEVQIDMYFSQGASPSDSPTVKGNSANGSFV